MTKKLMPLIVILCIFAALLLPATFYKIEKSTTSSTESKNKNINTDISTESADTTRQIKTDSKNESSNKSVPNMVVNDTQVVKEQKTNSENRKTDIDTSNYLRSLQCISYKLKSGETLTDIARKYESTCNLNSTIKMIKSINKIEDANTIDSKTVLNIPESTIRTGKMYAVVEGDTWYKVANENYPQYTHESVMKLLVYINNLPNNDLPLGERIFLPAI